MSDIVARLTNPPFGTETSERNLMADAAAEIVRLREALKEIDNLATRHEKGAIGKAQLIARSALDRKP